MDLRSSPIRTSTDLIRGLENVLKHSIWPKPCSPDPPQIHYGVSDLLSLSFPRRVGTILDAHVYHRLGNARCFELPAYFGWEYRFLRDIVPLQLRRSVIDSVTESVQEPPRTRAKMVISDEDTSYFSSSRDVVWMEAIKRWLPGSWADAQITDKAVKSDDSPVAFRPWHRRIQLVFPRLTSTLSVFERLGMRRWRSNACHSLFAYISGEYGIDWQSDFYSGSKRKINDSLSPSKQCQTDMETTSTLCRGGGGSRKRKTEMGSPRTRSELRVDVAKGLLVLVGQVIRSTW